MATKFVVPFITLVSLSGCIEIQDATKKEPEALVQQVEAPQDLLIDQPMVLVEGRILTLEDKEILQLKRKAALDETPDTFRFRFRRLTFTKEGSLQIYSHRLIIEAEELNSEEGRLYTYERDAKAPANTRGRDGGQVFLNAQYGRGILFVDMQGEQGGDGLSPAPPKEPVKDFDDRCRYLRGKKGADGKPGGNSGYITAQIGEALGVFAIQVTTTPGSGGQKELGVLGTYLQYISPESVCRASNTIYTQDGHHGVDGSRGISEVSTVLIKK